MGFLTGPEPNDTGYGEWCAAFAEAIGLDDS
jgi:hypothetical protein